MRKLLSILCVLCLVYTATHAQTFVLTPQWTPQSQFAGYYAAYELGLYEEAGLDVEIVHSTKSKSAVELIDEGKCNVITCELIQAVLARREGLMLTNILQTTQRNSLVVLCHKKGVKNLADLAGSRIGTWKVGFSEIPRLIDKQEQLGIEWIKQLNAINIYIAGAVDATLGKSFNEQILFAMSGIEPGTVLDFADLGYDFPEDGLYVKESFYKKYPEQCRKFAEASRKGWEWVRENREEALQIVMKYVKAEKVTTNLYHQKWMLEKILEIQEDVKGRKPSYTLKRDDLQRVSDMLLKYEYLSKPIDYERFIGAKQ